MKVKPRYKSKKYALEVLREIAPRFSLPENAILNSSEEWLLRVIVHLGAVSNKDAQLNVKMNLLGLAKTLELYPVPDWWIVRNRVLGIKVDNDHNFRWWGTNAELMFRKDTKWR